LGATFAGKNRNGLRRWSTTATVVACEPGRLFEIAVTTGRMPVARCRYEFEPTPLPGDRVLGGRAQHLH